MVDILMATYNGEQFVGEQIESILAQTCTDWRLIVHDDGSTDRTVAIINEFCQRDSRILLVDTDTKHLGVARNFIRLLNFSDSDFVMFCDQDDIWLPTKVEKMLAAISEKDNSRPQAVFSNAFLWNETRGIISNRNTLYYPRHIRELLFLNSGVQGAAAIFNAKMREIVRIPLDFYAMHDHVLTLAAVLLGEIDYIDQPLMKYRQHEHNVTGNAPGSMWRKFELMHQNRKVAVVFADHHRGLQSFYETHKNNISESDQKLIELFLEMPKMHFWKREKTIIKHRFSIFGSTKLLILKTLIRPFFETK